jgi:uncharacterized lipoprotein YddW (UPF0748 family)
MKKICCLLVAIALFASPLLAQPLYEFRAAWIATVDNIDWPSKGNYNTESQKAEYISLLDMHKRNGMNAVIVQVRPATDAFYPSQYEPWSEWLTGKQGKAPYPYYDPLQFMIEEAHKRGMEFHAWCNPYRAVFLEKRSSIAADHITKTHPEWFLSYGGTRYFDPGNKDAQQFVVKVIRDIVSRYDIDAIHFDDYFYPYPVAKKEFPDDVSYRKYGKGMDRGDWRRSNVDSVIVMLSRMIKEERPFCRFGVSPFGVWRNIAKDSEGSNTTAGLTNYDDLYADILLWLKNGWIDYVAPQIYFEFGHRAAPYEVLLDWWSKHTYGKHCYIGLGIYKVNSNAAWKDKTLIPREIKAMREYPDIQGAIYFSSKTFVGNPNGWSDSLRNNYYKTPALIPPMPWIDSVRPMYPSVKAVMPSETSVRITIVKPAIETRNLKCYRLYACYETNTAINNFNNSQLIGTLYDTDSCVFVAPLPADKTIARFFVTSVDENDMESLPYPNWPLSLEAKKFDKNVWILN